jgi:hypothetical protein
VDYLREIFRRGNAFNALQTAYHDPHPWLDTVGNRRIHDTPDRPIIDKEKPSIEPSILRAAETENRMAS